MQDSAATQGKTIRVGPLQQRLVAPAPTATRSRVRRATEADIDEMVEMFRIQHAASALRDAPLHEPKFRDLLRHAIGSREYACLVYEGPSGGLIGMMAGYVAPHFFSLETAASDLFLFVRPEVRGGIAAARLWSAFRAWAQEAGAGMLRLGTSGEAPERTRRFYTGLGMTEIGSVYAQRLNELVRRA
jgi:GNAT superfamily N-acetyltransferase